MPPRPKSFTLTELQLGALATDAFVRGYTLGCEHTNEMHNAKTVAGEKIKKDMSTLEQIAIPRKSSGKS